MMLNTIPTFSLLPVPNSQMERGLDWIDVKNPKFSKPDDNCGPKVCSQLATDVQNQYPDGFNKTEVPKFDELVRYHAVTEYTKVEGKCSPALMGGKKGDVCEVTFTVHTVPRVRIGQGN